MGTCACKGCENEVLNPRCKYCSHSCAAKSNNKRRRRTRKLWEPAADEYLEEIVGTGNLDHIYYTFNQRARHMGWASRTKRGIYNRIGKLGLHIRDMDWAVCMTNYEVAKLLGISHFSVLKWQNRHGLPYSTNKGGCYRTVRTFRLITWMTEHPELLVYVPIENIRLLFTEKERVKEFEILKEQIAKIPKRSITGIPIINETWGRKYDSLRQCVADINKNNAAAGIYCTIDNRTVRKVLDEKNGEWHGLKLRYGDA